MNSLALSIGREVEVGTGGTPEQKRITEPEPQPLKIKLHNNVLQLMPSDKDRSGGVHTSVHKTQTQHTLTRLYHRVGPKHAPNHALALQHQVDLWHAHP